MNDPNGLVHHKGVFHLFFQYNPLGDVWGNMSWGHATSKDLVHWEEQPLAIPFDADEGVFSGSVVVDTTNSSGFGTAKNPPLVAMYTSVYTPASSRDGIQAQSLAYSTDDGRTWTKYAGNPVIDIGSREFRDPKVFWYAPAKEWRMVAVIATEHKVLIWRSADLMAWTRLSEFGPRNATGRVWECPDLFPLAVDGDRRTVKWVMLVSLDPGGIAGGSGTQYFVGDFDGTTFTADGPATYDAPAGTLLQGFESGYAGWTPTGTAFGSELATGSARNGTERASWVDYGRDNYAGVSFNGLPDDQRTVLSWMSNWQYAGDVPTSPWRGQMTMPRTLSLVSSHDGLRLRQVPVAGVRKALVNRDKQQAKVRPVAQGERPTGLRATVARVEVRVALGTASEAGLVVRRSADGSVGTRIGVRRDGTLVVDRTRSGNVAFNPLFPSVEEAPLRVRHGEVTFTAYLDRSSVEVLAQDGTVSVTDLVFPPASATGIATYAVGGTAKAIDVKVTPIRP